MTNVMQVFQERGFIDQITHEKELVDCLAEKNVTCYIGFDPTASSLHIGSLVPIMSLAHMQRSGHRPIALVGGGTGLVGDPSGKTELRKLLTPEIVEKNIVGIKKQLSNFIDFTNGKALLLNNAEWLTKLEYISFLRDIGRHFSVNRMIKTETCKIRLASDEGLSFIEFNYMILQAYDFLTLFGVHGCKIQLGGSDQWGNIVAGIELIRRIQKKTAFGITFPLITTSSGAKMGKTTQGAVWLDPDRTSPYEYFQYWINTEDRDVGRFLALFTFLPMDEIRTAEKLGDSDLNYAKTILAFEATRLAHGREKAIKAYHAAAGMFGLDAVPEDVLFSSTIPRSDPEFDDFSVPQTIMETDQLEEGIPAFKLFHLVGLATSNSSARRLIEQGGAYINGKRIESFEYLITDNNLINREILLRSGKKRFLKIKVDRAKP